MKRKIFISYSHADIDWLKTLEKFLTGLNSEFEIWSDEKIEPGSNWKKEILTSIENSDAVILLITQNFLSSKFITENELPPILKKVKDEKLMDIFLIICETSTFKEHDNINEFQTVNPPEQPLESFSDIDRKIQLVDIAKRIKHKLKRIQDLTIPQASKKINNISPIQDSSSVEVVPKNISNNKSEKGILIFDIDNTILMRGESLSDSNQKRKLELFEYYIKNNWHIVFITGNNFEIQKKRVLEPILKYNLAECVTCFSDGGSRLFEYDKNINDYSQKKQYSQGHELQTEDINLINDSFLAASKKFFSTRKNHYICAPNIIENDKAPLQNGSLKTIELLIYPIRPKYFREKFHEIQNLLDEIVVAGNYESYCQITDRYKINNGLIIRITGKYAKTDASKLKDELKDRFTFWEEYINYSEPELEKRGSDNFISQITLKPFKDENTRVEFYTLFKDILSSSNNSDKYQILLGGRTSIDIQLNGVDKRKCIIELINGPNSFDPNKMIYFGNEFNIYGNDLPIAYLPKAKRPKRIINVGSSENIPVGILAKEIILNDGNSVFGTMNYLEFLKHELK